MIFVKRNLLSLALFIPSIGLVLWLAGEPKRGIGQEPKPSRTVVIEEESVVRAKLCSCKTLPDSAVAVEAPVPNSPLPSSSVASSFLTLDPNKSYTLTLDNVSGCSDRDGSTVTLTYGVPAGETGPNGWYGKKITENANGSDLGICFHLYGTGQSPQYAVLKSTCTGVDPDDPGAYCGNFVYWSWVSGSPLKFRAYPWTASGAVCCGGEVTATITQ